VRIGDYVLEGELGRGGMGRVYTGRHGPTGALRAVKVLDHGGDPEAIVRFRREAEALARAGSDVAVPIHESGQEQGRFYFVMDLMTGGSLEKRMKGPLPWREAARLVADLARKVGKLHAVGLVHRDLKPANVLFAEDGSARIADFGCVRDLSRSVLTQTGALLGTPAYMAPEQLGGERVGPPADVFALGAILHELVSGARPYAGSSWLQIMETHRRGERAPLEPPAIEKIAASALAADPTHRPSAIALANELEDAIAHDGASASRRMALVVVVVAALAAGALTWRRSGPAGTGATDAAPVTSSNVSPPTKDHGTGSPPSREDADAAVAFDEALKSLVTRALPYQIERPSSVFQKPERSGDWFEVTSPLLAAAARFSDGAREQPELVRRFQDRPSDGELDAVAALWDHRDKATDGRVGPFGPDRVCRAPIAGWRRGALLAFLGRPTFSGKGEPIAIAELPSSLCTGPAVPARWRFRYHETRLYRFDGYGPANLPRGWDPRAECALSAAELSDASGKGSGTGPGDLGKALELGVRFALACSRLPGRTAADREADFALARRLIEESSTSGGDPYYLAVRSGELAFATRDWAAAREAFLAADRANNDPKNVPFIKAHLALATVRLKHRDAERLVEEAHRLSDEAAERGARGEPDRLALYEAMMAKALFLEDRGRYSEALSEIAAIESLSAAKAIRCSTENTTAREKARIEAELRQSERR
jgi:serine/threonine protein kinase